MKLCDFKAHCASHAYASSKARTGEHFTLDRTEAIYKGNSYGSGRRNQFRLMVAVS